MNGVKTVTIDEINDVEVILNDYFDVIGQPFYHKINKVYNDGSISFDWILRKDNNDKVENYIVGIFELTRNSKYESIVYDSENKVYKCTTIRDWDTLTNEEKMLILSTETEKLHI